MAIIFVVEDDAEVARLVSESLKKRGHNVTHFENGATFMSSDALKAPPALIITDMLMPRLDGFKLCEELRKIPAFKETPIVAMTALGWGSQSVVEMPLRNFGVRTVLRKPFPLKALF